MTFNYELYEQKNVSCLIVRPVTKKLVNTLYFSCSRNAVDINIKVATEALSSSPQKNFIKDFEKLPR